MKAMLKLYTTLFLTLFFFSAFGQYSGQVKSTDELEQGYWIFGLNGGFSYQSSDVQALYNGFGLGATLGKNLYYQSGAPISFDLRGRLLFARNYGLDAQRSFDIENNSVLNGTTGLDYLHYPTELEEPKGFVFQNHQTDIGELALEGVITLNRLRENTGIVASLYGGIGLDWYRSKTDQADASGRAYYEGYSAINTNGSKATIRDDLKTAILDGNYESLADEFESGGKLGFMPSLGVEIGYEFTPRFSMHLGHRATFSGTNLLDGHQWADAQNDVYHYTNLAMRWKLFGRSRSTIAGPKIEIIQPFENSIISSNPRENIRARVSGVSGPTDIVCRINGRPISFDYNDGLVSVSPILEPGQNDFDISARTSSGSDQKSVRIFLEGNVITPPPPPPSLDRPNVVLTNPSRNNYTTNTENFQVKATIEGVDNKSDVQFFLNGREVKNFRFYGNNGRFQADIRLKTGANDIQIKGRNQAGSDLAEAKIYYEQRQQQLPSVRITDPQRSQIETDQSRITLKATIEHIVSKSGITLVVNGRTNRNFSYNESRKSLETTINLIEGRNQVEVIARNDHGEATDQVEINYRREVQQPKQPPYVRITTPEKSSTTTSQNEARIEASVDHVQAKNDIQFYLNGRREYNFSYSSQNGRLNHTVNLKEGENDIRIKAINSDGQDEARVSIRRIGDIQLELRPIVRISQPANNSETTNQTVSLKAEAKNVKNKSEISLLLNGTNVQNFSFNSSNKIISASLTLKPGANNIEVKARNGAGQDSDQAGINFQPAKPPVVSISSPANNSTSAKANISLRAAVREVSRKQDITLMVNGNRLSNFQFNASTDQLNAQIQLKEGSNQIKIEGRNAAGKDEAIIRVNYQKAAPPQIVWESPKPSSILKENQVNIRAQIKNIQTKSDLTLLLNGNRITSFSYAKGRLSATLKPLKKGGNQIEIIAENKDGRDSKTVKITYQPEVSEPKPVVQFLKPAKPGSSVTESQLTISASVKNVSGKEDVSLLVNGKVIKTFTYNAKGQRVEASITLKTGKNTIEITAKNSVGSNKGSTDITYRIGRARLPEVSFQSVSQPTINPLNPQIGRSSVIATVKNVTGKSQISFKLNGNSSQDFTFDSKSMRLQATVTLAKGVNTITIRAENRSGADEKSYEITF